MNNSNVLNGKNKLNSVILSEASTFHDYRKRNVQKYKTEEHLYIALLFVLNSIRLLVFFLYLFVLLLN